MADDETASFSSLLLSASISSPSSSSSSSPLPSANTHYQQSSSSFFPNNVVQSVVFLNNASITRDYKEKIASITETAANDFTTTATVDLLPLPKGFFRILKVYWRFMYVVTVITWHHPFGQIDQWTTVIINVISFFSDVAIDGVIQE